MKRLIYLLLCLPFALHSQNKIWGEDGARWMYEVLTQSGPGIYRVQQTGTEIKNGISCQEFTTTLYVFYHGPNFGDARFTNSKTEDVHYTYSSGDTVFLLVDNQFRVLYNFSASPGDQWDLGYDTSLTGCDPAIAEVTDTGRAVINGETLRYIDLKMTNDEPVVEIAGRVYEKIGRIGDTINGPSSSYLFPFHAISCTAIPETPQILLKCYKDNFFTEYTFRQGYEPIWKDDCDVNIWVGIDEQIAESGADIYPNPFSGFLQIDPKNESATVQIIDLSGRVLWEDAQLNGIVEINTLSWPSGMYFIRIVKQENIEVRNLIKTDPVR